MAFWCSTSILKKKYLARRNDMGFNPHLLLNVEPVPAVLACLSGGLMLWQWLAARGFPLHQRHPLVATPPGVTLLKPLKGCDPTTEASLRCWLTLPYRGPVQILFGVADPADPVVAIVERLQREFPAAGAELVICPEKIGHNGKVSTLIQLEPRVKHGLILISDADVRVPPDFLEQIVTPLNDPNVGLVNCFYRLANPQTVAMQWESIAVNADFWSQVVQSTTLQPPDFALGAVMLTRRSALASIGGFAALADCLADDYQLGKRIARQGHRIALSSVVVECWDRPMDWRAVWLHQVRWARTIRVCQPQPYFMSILANGTLWPALWLLVEVQGRQRAWVAATVLGLLLLRVIMAWDLQRRLPPERPLVAPLWLVPVKDLLHCLVWFNAFLGNTIEWRGQRLRLRPDGTLVPQ